MFFVLGLDEQLSLKCGFESHFMYNPLGLS